MTIHKVIPEDVSVQRRVYVPFGLFCLSLSLLLVFGGCEEKTDARQGKAKHDVEMSDPSENATEYEETDGSLVLKHAFGVLKPKQRVEHRFSIENKTATKWTVRKIINMCACTVSDMSAPTIEPGGKEEVAVEYRAGSGSHDDQRKVVVLFEEAKAPRVFLVIRAKIRESMTLDPPKVVFHEIGQGQSQSKDFEIHNFGGRAWKNVRIMPKVGWLHTTQTEISFESGKDLPRQVWRIGVTADAVGLSVGDHDGDILVEAKGVEEELTKSVSVRARVTSPIHAIPGQLFFGRIEAGKPAIQTIKVRFTSDAVPEDSSQIIFTHDLGDQLRLKWLTTDGSLWKLRATLTASQVDDLSKLKVVVVFPDSRLPNLELPIYAIVETHKQKEGQE